MLMVSRPGPRKIKYELPAIGLVEGHLVGLIGKGDPDPVVGSQVTLRADKYQILATRVKVGDRVHLVRQPKKDVVVKLGVAKVFRVRTDSDDEGQIVMRVKVVAGG